MNDFGLLVAQYNATLPTLADGQYAELQVDASGRLLVQADVTVLVDFLGLNGAADNANILVVGTEDGTSSGTAHALRLDTGGQVVISDGGSSITVDATDLDVRDITHVSDSIRLGDGTDLTTTTTVGADVGLDVNLITADVDIRDLSAAQDNVAISDGVETLAINADGSINSVVTATDLDIRQLLHTGANPDSVQIGDGTEVLAINADGSINIQDGGGSITVDAVDLDVRDLSATQDNVAISDGTNTLTVNADGSLNIQSQAAGSEQFSVTDALAGGGDGLETITATATPWVTVASYAHTSGTAYIYGYQYAADQNVQARLVTNDGVNDVIYKTSVNSSAMPSVSEHFSEGGRIEIPGSAGLEIRLQLKKRSVPGGNAQGTGSMHIRTV